MRAVRNCQFTVFTETLRCSCHAATSPILVSRSVTRQFKHRKCCVQNFFWNAPGTCAEIAIETPSVLCCQDTSFNVMPHVPPASSGIDLVHDHHRWSTTHRRRMMTRRSGPTDTLDTERRQLQDANAGPRPRKDDTRAKILMGGFLIAETTHMPALRPRVEPVMADGASAGAIDTPSIRSALAATSA